MNIFGKITFDDFYEHMNEKKEGKAIGAAARRRVYKQKLRHVTPRSSKHFYADWLLSARRLDDPDGPFVWVTLAQTCHWPSHSSSSFSSSSLTLHFSAFPTTLKRSFNHSRWSVCFSFLVLSRRRRRRRPRPLFPPRPSDRRYAEPSVGPWPRGEDYTTLVKPYGPFNVIDIHATHTGSFIIALRYVYNSVFALFDMIYRRTARRRT